MEKACFLALGAAAQSRPSGSGITVFKQLSAYGLRDCFLQTLATPLSLKSYAFSIRPIDIKHFMPPATITTPTTLITLTTITSLPSNHHEGKKFFREFYHKYKTCKKYFYIYSDYAFFSYP